MSERLRGWAPWVLAGALWVLMVAVLLAAPLGELSPAWWIASAWLMGVLTSRAEADALRRKLERERQERAESFWTRESGPFYGELGGSSLNGEGNPVVAEWLRHGEPYGGYATEADL